MIKRDLRHLVVLVVGAVQDGALIALPTSQHVDPATHHKVGGIVRALSGRLVNCFKHLSQMCIVQQPELRPATQTQVVGSSRPS